MPRYSLGLDYGTSSLRALLVDLDRGREAAQATGTYGHGDEGVIVDGREPDLARQHPPDYLDALREVVPAVMRAADARPDDVVGIGVDTTGSTPIPVDRQGCALAEHPEFREHPAAQAWLWKDHTSSAEAAELTEHARAVRPHFLARCGGTYSSEWFWSKILRCLRSAPDVFAAAHSWVELCDFVPGWLTGTRAPESLRRSVCAAGHKALYADEWGGLPDAEFLGGLAPELAVLRGRLDFRAATADQQAGALAAVPAAALGLRPGIPVAVGAFDAHLGAVGAGIAAGDLVKVIGTSSCDMAVAPDTGSVPDARGLSGVVRGSILPGMLGFEAGQSAVGDVFAATARLLQAGDHEGLSEAARALRAGESGLLALDWHNGNRCVLVDPALSGAVLGLSLHTTPGELYRAMIEATAFGARVIVERMVELGVPVRALIACGGIASKSPLVMQIYADVLGRPLRVAASTQASALGAAIMGAVVGGAFADAASAQRALVAAPTREYVPRAGERDVYDELFRAYSVLHDAFGTRTGAGELGGVMKQLLALRGRVREGSGG
ncbi:MAG: ribulokinase [Planctomycetota bacterium]